MTTPFVTHHTTFINDVRLHYVTAGQGDPVILLHGWPETWYQWRKIIPALAERYTVIAPDMRGLGDSSKSRYRLRQTHDRCGHLPTCAEAWFSTHLSGRA